MGVDWIVLGVVVLFILLDTGLIIAFIKQCEESEMELLRDIYEECHPKKEEKKPNLVWEDIPIIDDKDIDSTYKDEENDENELMCLSCKYGDNQTVLRCKYCDFSTNWVNFEPKNKRED